MHEKRRENREREMPWTALFDPRRRRGVRCAALARACRWGGGALQARRPHPRAGHAVCCACRARPRPRRQGSAGAGSQGWSRGTWWRAGLAVRRCPMSAGADPGASCTFESFVSSVPANGWGWTPRRRFSGSESLPPRASRVRVAVATAIRSSPTVLHHLFAASDEPGSRTRQQHSMITPAAPA